MGLWTAYAVQEQSPSRGSARSSSSIDRVGFSPLCLDGGADVFCPEVLSEVVVPSEVVFPEVFGKVVVSPAVLVKVDFSDCTSAESSKKVARVG